jgi:phospholipid/cholesterol/gamma-HCH transport system substrate-binding protein
MKMHYSHRLSQRRIAQIVGVFVAVPVIGAVVIGLFMAQAEHLFETKFRLHLNISKSYGLEPGAPVVMSGIPIGSVERVEFNERGTIDVRLQILSGYRDKIRQDSVATVAKTSFVMGQTQVDIAMGGAQQPVLEDGATLRATEPRELAELLDDVKPVIESIHRSVLRVEEITTDVQTLIRRGDTVLASVHDSTRAMPEIVASARRSMESLERTTASLPPLTSKLDRTLDTANETVAHVRTATAKMPAIMGEVQESIRNVKTMTESLKQTTREMPPIVRAAQDTLDDVHVIVKGAKRTFPISTMVKNAEPESAAPRTDGLRSLRGEELTQR